MTTSTLYRKETDEERWVQEQKEPHRSCFRRDYARLIHSPVFRRLQGKTQLFPNFESDFFRNRLTHSLEVAQVAKSIAQFLNETVGEFAQNKINEDIVEFAGLAHDLGHPPFGHNGERALDACMEKFGGFEGNAQTLRNLRMEKKVIHRDAPAEARGCGVDFEGMDFRAGLNLTARSLAAVLKYDRLMPVKREEGAPRKGYYSCDQALVRWIKTTILPEKYRDKEMKTIECQIMDLADDIAYSTYDLEDAFKAGFLSPMEILALGEGIRKNIAKKVEPIVGEPFESHDVLAIFMETFGWIAASESDRTEDPTSDDLSRRLKTAIISHSVSASAATNGYIRNAVMSELVSDAVRGVELVEYNSECPMLSKIRLRSDVLRRVETLKRVAHYAIVETPRLKVAEYRGFQVVKEIFAALSQGEGNLLLPADYKELYRRFSGDEVARHRLICDFIAGMTDAYAIEFYSRLKSVDANLLFKPH